MFVLSINPAIAFEHSFSKPLPHANYPLQHPRSRSLVASGSAILERAPAPPPAPPREGNGGNNGGGGGGNNGGGDNLALRKLSPVEQASILDDWISRSKIYRMTGEMFGGGDLPRTHGDALETLEMLRMFDTTDTKHALDHRLFLAIEENDNSKSSVPGGDDTDGKRILAVASVTLIVGKGLIVSNMAVYPGDLNDELATIRIRYRMLLALRRMAIILSVPIDIANLPENGHVFFSDQPKKQE